jgi:hypothetical protein
MQYSIEKCYSLAITQIVLMSLLPEMETAA